MKQATLGLSLDIKTTRKRQFLEQMDQVVPWAALVELIARQFLTVWRSTLQAFTCVDRCGIQHPIRPPIPGGSAQTVF